MLRRFLQTALLLSISLGVSVALLLQGLETYLRWQQSRTPGYHGAPHPGVFEQNEIWGYSMKPSVEFEVRHPEFTPRVTSNAMGFRGGEDRLPELSGEDVPRAVLLGDSFVMGMQVADDEIVVSRLEALRSDWAFWSFGIDGWGTTNAVAALRHFVADIQPRLVILMFYENDFRNNGEPLDKYFIVDGFRFRRYCPGTEIRIPEEELMPNIERVLAGEMTAAFTHPRIQRLCRVLRGTDPKPSLGGKLKNLIARYHPLSYRYLVKQVRLDIVNAARRAPEPVSEWLQGLMGLFFYVPPEVDDAPIPESAVEQTRREMRNLQAICLEHGCELKAVIIPERFVIEEETDPAVEIARRMFEELGVGYHDPRDDIIMGGGRSLYWVHDAHFTAEGNRVLAESIVKTPWFDELSGDRLEPPSE